MKKNSVNVNNNFKISVAESDASTTESTIIKEVQDFDMNNIPAVLTGWQLFNYPITETPMIIESLIPSGVLIVLIGSSGSGKSTFARYLAVSIVLKKEMVLGLKITAKYYSVIYVSLEDSWINLSVVLKKQFRTEEELFLLDNIYFLFDSAELLEMLNKFLTSIPVDLIIIDPLGDVIDGDLNSSFIVRESLKGFSNLIQKYGCSILVVHHPRKASENSSPSKLNSSGSESITSKARHVLYFENDGHNNIRLTIVKSNYLANDEEFRTFKLHFNDDLTFSRIESFSEDNKIPLVKNQEKIDKVINLYKQGNSNRQIAEALQNSGEKIGKTTVNRIIKEFSSANNNATINPEKENNKHFELKTLI